MAYIKPPQSFGPQRFEIGYEILAVDLFDSVLSMAVLELDVFTVEQVETFNVITDFRSNQPRLQVYCASSFQVVALIPDAVKLSSDDGHSVIHLK